MANYRVDIGRMNKRITIQKGFPTKGEWDQTTNDWTNWKNIWASINSLFGREFWQAKEANMENTINITVRYSRSLKDLDSREYRISWDNKFYDIIFIDNINFSNKYLVFKCIEVLE